MKVADRSVNNLVSLQRVRAEVARSASKGVRADGLEGVSEELRSREAKAREGLAKLEKEQAAAAMRSHGGFIGLSLGGLLGAGLATGELLGHLRTLSPLAALNPTSALVSVVLQGATFIAARGAVFGLSYRKMAQSLAEPIAVQSDKKALDLGVRADSADVQRERAASKTQVAIEDGAAGRRMARTAVRRAQEDLETVQQAKRQVVANLGTRGGGPMPGSASTTTRTIEAARFQVAVAEERWGQAETRAARREAEARRAEAHEFRREAAEHARRRLERTAWLGVAETVVSLAAEAFGASALLAATSAASAATSAASAAAAEAVEAAKLGSTAVGVVGRGLSLASVLNTDGKERRSLRSAEGQELEAQAARNRGAEGRAVAVEARANQDSIEAWARDAREAAASGAPGGGAVRGVSFQALQRARLEVALGDEDDARREHRTSSTHTIELGLSAIAARRQADKAEAVKAVINGVVAGAQLAGSATQLVGQVTDSAAAEWDGLQPSIDAVGQTSQLIDALRGDRSAKHLRRAETLELQRKAVGSVDEGAQASIEEAQAAKQKVFELALEAARGRPVQMG